MEPFLKIYKLIQLPYKEPNNYREVEKITEDLLKTLSRLHDFVIRLYLTFKEQIISL